MNDVTIANFTVPDLIGEALRVFGTEFDQDLAVNGAELVQWFAGWRAKMIAANAQVEVERGAKALASMNATLDAWAKEILEDREAARAGPWSRYDANEVASHFFKYLDEMEKITGRAF